MQTVSTTIIRKVFIYIDGYRKREGNEDVAR